LPENPSSSLQNPETLRWTVHLAREHPTKLFASIGACALAAWCAAGILGWIGALAVVVVVVCALAEFLFPVSYQITTDEASCRTVFARTSITWEKVKNCYLDNLGIKLSPLAKGSRLEAYRGIYLRFAGNREEVIQAVRAMRAKQQQ